MSRTKFSREKRKKQKERNRKKANKKARGYSLSFTTTGSMSELTAGMIPVETPIDRSRVRLFQIQPNGREAEFFTWEGWRASGRNVPTMSEDWRWRHSVCSMPLSGMPLSGMPLSGMPPKTLIEDIHPRHMMTTALRSFADQLYCSSCQRKIQLTEIYVGLVRPVRPRDPHDTDEYREQARFGKLIATIEADVAGKWWKTLAWCLFYPAAYYHGHINRLGLYWEFMPILIDAFLSLEVSSLPLPEAHLSFAMMPLTADEQADMEARRAPQPGSPITPDELKLLEGARSEDDWNKACDRIKRGRGGNYPPDWFDRVNRSGLMASIFKRFNMSTDADRSYLTQREK